MKRAQEDSGDATTNKRPTATATQSQEREQVASDDRHVLCGICEQQPAVFKQNHPSAVGACKACREMKCNKCPRKLKVGPFRKCNCRRGETWVHEGCADEGFSWCKRCAKEGTPASIKKRPLEEQSVDVEIYNADAGDAAAVHSSVKSISVVPSHTVGDVLLQVLAAYHIPEDDAENFYLVLDDADTGECPILDNLNAVMHNLEIHHDHMLGLFEKKKGEQEAAGPDHEQMRALKRDNGDSDDDPGSAVGVAVSEKTTGQLLHEVKSILRQLQSFAEKASVSLDLVSDVRAALHRVEANRLKIVVVGNMGAGKSELINRMVMGIWAAATEAKMPLPSYFGGSSLTRYITEVSWAEEWCVDVLLEGDRLFEPWRLGSEPGGVKDVFNILCNFEESFKRKMGLTETTSNIAIEREVVLIRVQGPFSGLDKNRDVVLVDTPGYAEGDERFQGKQLLRFQRQVQSASALLVVGPRIKDVALGKTFECAGLNAKQSPSIIIGSCLAEEHKLDSKIRAGHLDLLQEALNAAMQKWTPAGEGTSIRDMWSYVGALRKTAMILYRNSSVPAMHTFFERVRQSVVKSRLVDVYDCLSTLWFAVNLKAGKTSPGKGVAAAAKKEKSDRGKLRTIFEHVRTQLDVRWGLSEEVQLREMQCLLALVEPDGPASQELSAGAPLLGDLLMHLSLDQLCEEVLCYGRFSLESCADFAAEKFHSRIVSGKEKRGAQLKVQIEAAASALSENDDDSGAADDDGEMIARLFRRKAIQLFDAQIAQLRQEIEELWSKNSLDGLRNWGVAGWSGEDEWFSSEAELRGDIRKLVTRPALALLRESVDGVISNVHEWIVSEFVDKTPALGDTGMRSTLQTLLKQMKSLFRTFMREKEAVLPKTDLRNAEPPVDRDVVIRDAVLQKMEALSRAKGGKRSRIPITLAVPGPHRSASTDLENEKILKLHWDADDDCRICLNVSARTWMALQDFSTRLNNFYSHPSPLDHDAAERLLSPIFCFASVEKAEDVSTYRCRNLFDKKRHEDEDIACRMMFYVIYEDQLDLFQDLTNRDASTFLITMPSDANLMVGQDAVKLLCEHLKFPFRWAVPAHLRDASMFHRNVIQARTCSPASMFFCVENGQLGPLLRACLEQVWKLFRENSGQEGFHLFAMAGRIRDEELKAEAQRIFFKFLHGDVKINVWDVNELLDMLATLARAEEDAAKNFREKILGIMNPFLHASEVQIRHGAFFQVNWLVHQGRIEQVQSFRLRSSRQKSTGVVLSNVLAQRPFSHFPANHVWKGEHLRQARPETEEEFRRLYEDNLNKLLSSCAGAGLLGFLNDQFMWGGNFATHSVSTRGRSAKKSKSSGSSKVVKRRTPAKRSIFSNDVGPPIVRHEEESDSDDGLRDYFSAEEDAGVQEQIRRRGLGDGFYRQKVPGDGDCGPTSLSLYVGADASLLRFQVERWALSRPEFKQLLEAFPDDRHLPATEVIERIGRDQEWVGLEFFRAAAELLGRTIAIVTPEHIQVFRPADTTATEAKLLAREDTIFIAYNGRNHFDCLIRRARRSDKK